MQPSFEQFVAALRDPAQRPGIRLAISDQDAATLLTRSDWANDYYTRWLALFPAVAAEQVPPQFATATPSPQPQFGPPPAAAFGGSTITSTLDAPVWTVAPRRQLAPWARIAIIVVITVIALWIVAGVINAVATATHPSPVAAVKMPSSPTTLPPSSGDTTDDPIFFHGLTQTEYALLEAVLAPQGHTLEEAVANGASDADLSRLAVSTESSTATSCRDGEDLRDGFDNPTFRASFILAYESAQKATQEQAVAVYDALAAYCDHH